MNDAGTVAGAPPTQRYVNLVLVLLVCAYVINFIDRTIVATLAEAIKQDLQISDKQVGLLQGFAFVVLYTFAGVPIARLAEKRSRVTIISVCMLIWSGLTMVCGLAQNFLQLLIARIGVGIGEAGCTPPAHSLITDYVPAQRRATALSIYALGVPLGTMLGVMIGGVVVHYLDWRQAFFIVGLPGILLALLIKLLIREPLRGQADSMDALASQSRHEQENSLLAVARLMLAHRSVVHFVVAITLTSFAVGGSFAFSQPYFLREFGLSIAFIGIVFGLAGGLSQAVSTIMGGVLADSTARRDVRWYGYLPALGLAIATPMYLAMFNIGSWQVAIAFLVLGGLFMNAYIAPTFGAVYRIVPPHMRATAAALILMSINFGGLGPGPFFAGWMIDVAGQHQFAQLGLGDFLTACPGGRAPAGADAALASACHDTLAGATRFGLNVVLLVNAWAIVHYLLAAKHLVTDLQRMSKG